MKKDIDSSQEVETVIEFIPDFSLDDDSVESIEEMVTKALNDRTENEEWENDKKSQRGIVVDIDGTLSNCVPRLEVSKKKDGKLNWKKFFADMENDHPNEWCVRLVQIYYKMGFVVYIVSGRPNEYRDKTERWLAKYGVPYDFLYMRATGDYRQDDIVKKEILERDICPKELIEFVVDDRKIVIDMWRREGLTCLACNSHE